MITFIIDIFLKVIYYYGVFILSILLASLILVLSLYINNKDNTKTTKNIKFDKFGISIHIKQE